MALSMRSAWRALGWILGGLIALVAALALGGLLLSSEFRVERSVQIKAPPDRVYALLADPRRWKEWSVWNQRDPAMLIRYEGPPSGSGAVWAWTSATEGDGRMTFTTAEPGRRLGYELYFPDFGTTSVGDFTLTPQGEFTTVRWLMNGNMGTNPLFRWLALFADGMVGADFEAGLGALKSLAEKG